MTQWCEVLEVNSIDRVNSTSGRLVIGLLVGAGNIRPEYACCEVWTNDGGF